MKILKEGKAHLHNIWTVICPYCHSKLRILDGDPMMYKNWIGQHNIGYELRYICAVCGGQVAEELSLNDEHQRVIFEKDIRLTDEDREEIESWGDISWDTFENLDDLDKRFIHAYRYYPG